MIVRPYGNPVRRPGTKYVGAVKDSTEDVRLIEFVFNTATSYIIEMGNLYLRFYKDNELVTLDLDAIAAWQTATAYSVDDLVKIVDGASVKYYLCTVEHTSAATISGGTYDAWETDTDYTNTGSWWQVETADQVSHNGKNYTCKDTHTSEAKYEPGVGSRWTQAWRVWDLMRKTIIGRNLSLLKIKLGYGLLKSRLHTLRLRFGMLITHKKMM